MPGELILEMKGISKSFPGVKVFENFNFDLRRGEIHCICGENGAGKSTLIKMLSGAYTPDKGEIYFDGKKRCHSHRIPLCRLASRRFTRSIPFSR